LSQHAHGRGRLLAALLPILLLVFAAPAEARLKVIPPKKQTGRTLVYKVGQLKPQTVRSARLKAGSRVRKLRTRRVRAAASRGRLRVRMSRRWMQARRRARRLARMTRARRARMGRRRWRQARKQAMQAGQRPRLIVGVGAPQPGAPKKPDRKLSALGPLADLGPIPAGALYVAPNGSDAGPGTAEQPWRTLDRALEAVGPGDTVVLRAGTYGARGTTHVMDAAGAAGAPITWRGHPADPMPAILGHFKVTGSHQRFGHLLFDGPTGGVKPLTPDNPDGEQVQVAVSGADGVQILGCEIRDSGWHAGVYLDGAADAVIAGNHIHDNGDFGDPSQSNQSHGIYWHSGSGVIANNLIEHNVARGVQLYQEPHGVTIAYNTIVRNGKSGIQFAEDTRDSLAVNNVVAFNGEFGIRGADLAGPGNAAVRNLVWGNPKGNLAMLGTLRAEDNMTAEVRFEAGYRLSAASPAVDEGSPFLAPPKDYAGSPRTRGRAPDLGAFESH
jgi:Right handed beta helix region/Protein of unknown function (DUF1565)